MHVQTGVNGRFILNQQSMWLREMAKTLRAHYPQMKIRTCEPVPGRLPVSAVGPCW